MTNPVQLPDHAPPVINPIYYFDMDGVLCAYNHSDYKPGRDGRTPYLTPGVHIYRNIPENPTVMEAFALLYGLVPPGTCRILTTIPIGVTQAEHTLDKYAWVTSRLPKFRQDDFLCVSVPKHSAAATPMMPLGPNSILIDDWNQNLTAWAAHGGTPVKMLNGINSQNQAFINISAGWQAWDIMQAIRQAGQTGAYAAAAQAAAAFAGII